MSYPNSKQWKLYDMVIHARDAKEHRMLRRVTGFKRIGGMLFALTSYAFPNELPENWRTRTGCDLICFLHDPKRYGLSANEHSDIRTAAMSKTTV